MPYPILDQTFKNLTIHEYNTAKEELVKYQPKTIESKYNRVMFAQLSIKQNCTNNVRSYRHLKKTFEATFKDEESVKAAVKASKAGLIKVRSKGLWVSNKKHNEDNLFYTKREGETWRECRSRWRGQIYGIGLAKISFTLELMYPLDAKLVCLDTHLLTQFGHNKDRLNPIEYQTYEDYFLAKCEEMKLTPTAAREAIWRKLAGENKENEPSWLTRSFEDELTVPAVA